MLNEVLSSKNKLLQTLMTNVRQCAYKLSTLLPWLALSQISYIKFCNVMLQSCLNKQIFSK